MGNKFFNKPTFLLHNFFYFKSTFQAYESSSGTYMRKWIQPTQKQYCAVYIYPWTNTYHHYCCICTLQPATDTYIVGKNFCRKKCQQVQIQQPHIYLLILRLSGLTVQYLFSFRLFCTFLITVEFFPKKADSISSCDVIKGSPNF